MKHLLPLLLASMSLPGQVPGQPLDADAIMRRVSSNVGRAEAARAAWVYDHDVFVRLKRANGKLAREESRLYTVAPTEKGATRKLVKVEGTILEAGKEINYKQAGFRQKDSDIDGAIVNNIAREIMWRRNSMGLMEYWDPLQSPNLDKYDFKLEGEERYRDYDVYRISFHAKKDFWVGEALIDRSEYQPVLVTSAWAGKVPMAVTLMLGTNVKQVGAKLPIRGSTRISGFRSSAVARSNFAFCFYTPAPSRSAEVIMIFAKRMSRVRSSSAVRPRTSNRALISSISNGQIVDKRS